MGCGIANLKVVGTGRNRISYNKLQESQRKGKELEVKCTGGSSPPIEYDWVDIAGNLTFFSYMFPYNLGLRKFKKRRKLSERRQKQQRKQKE